MTAFDITSLIIRTPLPELSALEKSVLIAMADRASNSGTASYPGLDALCECTGAKRTAVITARKELENLGYIIRDLTDAGDSFYSIRKESRPTCYRIDVEKIISLAEEAVAGYDITHKTTSRKTGEVSTKVEQVSVSDGLVRSRIDAIAGKRKSKTKAETTAKDASNVVELHKTADKPEQEKKQFVRRTRKIKHTGTK